MSEREEDAALLSHMLQTDGLPGVLVGNRPLRAMSHDVLHHLVHTKTPIYVRHGELVRIVRKEDGTPFIETLSQDAFKGILARAMNFVKLTAKGPQHVAPPDNIVKDILSIGAWPFAPLDSIIEFPVFRPDGTLIDSPGYDATTRLAYVPLPTLKIPPIPNHPSEEDIVNAMTVIDEAIGEFPYQNEASFFNAIGLLLTPLIRQSIRGQVPLALIDATRPGTGKSLLAETVAMIATGRKAAMMTAPYDDDEWRKRIASTLAEGATIITIDNIKARLEAASLDAALTSSVVKERVLGQSKNGIYPQRATWMATGNNIQVGGDLPRRTYWIRMDARMDKPWTRGGFKHDLEEWVPAHRGELIAALLTLARAWYAAGSPAAKVPRMGNFQSWADTIGGILAHSWFGNESPFLGNLDALYEQADDDAMQWAAFLHAWHDLYKEQEVPVSQLAKDIKNGSFDGGDTTLGVAGLYNALPDDLSDIQKGDFKRRLGKALASRVGSLFDESGLHLERVRTDKRSGVAYWRVADVQISQIAIPQKEENFTTNTPLESLGGGVSGDIPSEKRPWTEENKSATSAHLQGIASPTVDEQGYPGWQHLHLFDFVISPKGDGVIVQNWPRSVGVRLNSTQLVVYFERREDILRIRRITYMPQSPDEWPYNDPAWTDEKLYQEGYPTRQELHYAPPESGKQTPEEDA
ncbi:MAG: hypothetical protein JO202_12620 [Ktedonobacteraceae bacterium]|nr:hypothetical protein [Ktedonobacteraceae bacterium]